MRSKIQRSLSCICFSLLCSGFGFGATYYVATSGNNANDGLSRRTAWRNVQYAANHVQAGDTVNVLGGVYNETVNIPASGSAAAGYITLQNYSKQAAILDGTGLTIPGGQYGMINIASQSYIIVKGLEVRNYKSSSRSNVPVGIYITGAGSHLQLLNNHVHDIVTTATGCGANALGVAIYGSEAPAALNHLTISGNELDHLKTGCSESMSLNGNVDTFTVTNNLIHDNNNIGIDVIGFEGTSPNPAYDQARNGTVSQNTVYNISSDGNPSYPKNCWCSDGIYVDGGTNVIVERNLIHNVDLGIEIASEHKNKTSSFVTARNNLIYFGNSAGVSIGGYAAGVGGTDHVTIVNNTLYKNDGQNTGSGEFQIQFHATNNVFKNNIVYAGAQGYMVNNYTKSTPNPADVDYNLYYSSANASGTTWLWVGKTYSGFTAYQSGSGEDSHSNYADPLFVNPTTPDLHVQAASRAVNAGINLGTGVVGATDYAGNPRVQGSNIDIGGYEQ
ncbi:MAG: right-handed parallel beta-helix repeat-containing protein [Acidobacteria bacterium]|nr:right-handed parallel beta-helix repeat-containing protein [Acidobacteriota bacterium]